MITHQPGVSRVASALVIIGDSMVTEDRAVSRVESVYRVYAGPGGGHAMWGWLGWLLIKYQYRCLLLCTLATAPVCLQRELNKSYN